MEPQVPALGSLRPVSCHAKLSQASQYPVSTLRSHLADSTRMAESHADDAETLTYRLILPRDANHHGTLYAGVLLSLALEAGYATAFRAAGLNANLVLKRVLDLRCYEPVPVGRVIQIRGREIHRARARSSSRSRVLSSSTRYRRGWMEPCNSSRSIATAGPSLLMTSQRRRPSHWALRGPSYGIGCVSFCISGENQ